MAQRVYIHIGAPKTGTTFLQTAMWRNRSQLEAQGFLYPGKKRIDHYRASQVVRDVPASRLGDDADAWDRIVSGASLVQLYSAMVYEGPGLAKRIADGLAKRLGREGMASIAEAVGSG